jgi:hypothetical protein
MFPSFINASRGKSILPVGGKKKTRKSIFMKVPDFLSQFFYMVNRPATDVTSLKHLFNERFHWDLNF